MFRESPGVAGHESAVRNSTLSPFRTIIAQACVEPRTRQQLFDACGGRPAIGRQRFQNLLQTMLNAGAIERAGEIPNPLHGQGRNNNPMVLVFRSRSAP